MDKMAAIAGLWFLFGLAVFSSSQTNPWEREWNETLAAAREEGKVVVHGPPNRIVRREVPARFTARFGIPVEYLGGQTTEIASRLRSERGADIYTVDVFLSGVGTTGPILYPEKMLDPLKPLLILPEVVDPSKWKKGKLWFVDPEEKYVLRLLNYANAVLYLNTRHAKPEEFQSIRDLLHPKWRGKISAFDPTISQGLNTAALFYIQLGEEFVRRLYVDQQPAISRDSRQIADWLGRGTYPISIDGSSAQVDQMRQDGLPVMNVYSLPDLAGPVTAGSGVVALANRAPHPNAARVFINWIASREGLDVYARAYLHATTRADIDEASFVPAGQIPRPGIRYFDDSDWKFTTVDKQKVKAIMNEMMKLR
jgi:iron(III) transport system substrate-binding protein